MNAQICPNAIVIDTGSHTTKIGFSGDTEPQCVIPTATGTIDNDDNKNNNNNHNNNSKTNKYLIDEQLNTMDLNKIYKMDIQLPYKNGFVYNMESLSSIWLNTIKNKLKISDQNLESIPLLLSEPCYWNSTSIYSSLFNKYRLNYCSIIFEQFNSCGMYLCSDSVLSSFSHGKKSSIVLDLGDGLTKCTPIYDGYIINNGCKFTKCSGEYFNKLILNKIENELNIKIQTKYLIKNNNLNNNISNSYKNYLKYQIINEIKQNVLRIKTTNLNDKFINLPFNYKKNDTYENNINNNNNNNIIKEETNCKKFEYLLPDGQKLDCSDWQYNIPELLFMDYYSDFARDFEDEWIDKMFKQNNNNKNNIYSQNTKQIWNDKQYKTFKFKGIASMINESLNGCDIDIKPLCCKNIIICGGQSIYKGIIERITKELTINLPYSLKYKLIFNNIPKQRLFNVWLGGSILSMSKYLENMWITKNDYNEYGKNIIYRKCY